MGRSSHTLDTEDEVGGGWHALKRMFYVGQKRDNLSRYRSRIEPLPTVLHCSADLGSEVPVEHPSRDTVAVDPACDLGQEAYGRIGGYARPLTPKVMFGRDAQTTGNRLVSRGFGGGRRCSGCWGWGGWLGMFGGGPWAQIKVC